MSLIAGSLLSVVPHAAPVHLETLRLAVALRPMAMTARHATLFAPWYAEAVVLRERIPANHAVDFVMANDRARDVAVLAGALLAPRDVRFFAGWPAWRSRDRATFLHADSAVNAAPGPPPPPAPVVVLVDAGATPVLRVVTAPR